MKTWPVIGIYGLDLLVMLSNCALTLAAFWLLGRSGRREDLPEIDRRSAGRGPGALAVLLAGRPGLSLALYGAKRQSPLVRVAAIQPNLPRTARRDAASSAWRCWRRG